ncbi:hypothetical protein JRO89_XS02G0035400 [Xanthoceras sorbifolium]|uniref:Uncharacterized protein n=1 Tax=Xanthoceras sorbifolium TaxID=99658 RepID=A0ABQ8IEE0_9ROSI|nr:hypothetical protein JRO89_XS02G0035400 [Xanthoceras sorbifolium]
MLGGGSNSSGSTSTRCKDCGNQAKKNCVYMRCRTCCKRKGFQCQTHIKSTWIPAYRRHQKQYHQQHQLIIASQPTVQEQQLLQGHNSTYNPKRIRENPSSGLEVGNFPVQMSSESTFHCVRVSSIDEGIDQYAYHTSVNIGGHIFKGILYDQGPDAGHHHHHHHQSCNYTVGESSSSEPVPLPPSQQQHQPDFTVNVATTTCTTSSAATDHHHQTPIPSPYNTFPFSPFMPGTQFFPHPKS